MREPIIVAAVQLAPKLGAIEDNLRIAQQMTFEAAAKGARVIVLPELAISGRHLQGTREATNAAQTRDGYQTQAFQPFADKFNCHVVFGCVEISEGKLYNSAIVVGPRTRPVSTMKHNLEGPDNLWAKSSDREPNPVILTDAGRLGILICRDVMNRYRSSFTGRDSDHKFYRKGSVDTVALLTNWGEAYSYPDSSWVELSEELSCHVIVANRVGEEGDIKFRGGSCVIDRDRTIWTHGSSFVEPAVVGGAVVIER